MNTPEPLQQTRLLLWDSDIAAGGDGRAVVTARRLVSDCSVERACVILGIPLRRKALIYRLYRAGLLKGGKPGAIATRGDGRKSNAKLVLDMESVLEYREKDRRRRA